MENKKKRNLRILKLPHVSAALAVCANARGQLIREAQLLQAGVAPRASAQRARKTDGREGGRQFAGRFRGGAC